MCAVCVSLVTVCYVHKIGKEHQFFSFLFKMMFPKAKPSYLDLGPIFPFFLFALHNDKKKQSSEHRIA